MVVNLWVGEGRGGKVIIKIYLVKKMYFILVFCVFENYIILDKLRLYFIRGIVKF